MRLPWRRPRTTVELDPVDVTIVRLLLEAKAAPDREIHRTVAHEHGAAASDTAATLARLVEREVLEVRLQPEDGSRWFVLAPLGRRLKGRLPVGLRSGIVIYL